MSIQTSRLEPIAIIGIGCRLPGGANSPEKFWELLCKGIDAVGDVPAQRWQASDVPFSKRVDLALRRGGFLQNLDQFDPQFFGITPREAALMDPQQRLLLEVAWEAIEDAGVVPANIAGSNSSVFIGISTQDYGMLEAAAADRSLIDAYTNSGVGMCIAANRISYFLDLRGPSVAVDTACSSSLVAVHLACQSIRNEGCRLAIAGGVNALIRLESSIGFHRASMLSPQGKCKSFDAEADGYVRSEGCGAVVLRPLSLALAANDSIYAVIRATAVNQSGHGPGITVPSGKAQESLLREAYRRSRVRLSEVDYIEAHGTGTPVGDPIEAIAIGATVGRGRSRTRPCVIGSVKSNIGHLEAASGVAGLIKAVLCIKNGEIPASLHFRSPPTNVAFDRLRLRVPQTLEPWPDTAGRPRIAGVNSFGFGGVNAHVVLEESRPRQSSPEKDGDSLDRAFLLPISARSPAALPYLAKAYLETSSDLRLAQLCYSAAIRREHHDYRLTLVIRSQEDFADGVNAFLAGERRPHTSCDRTRPGRSPQISFVFSGMGPERAGMGNGLVNEPVWRESMEECDRLLRRFVDWSLLEELARPGGSSRIHDVRIAQPAVFALQVSLAALWRSWGVEPSTIIGHSVGEVAAAHVAGVLSLEDSVAVIFHRSRLQHRAKGDGTLLAVALPSGEAEKLIGSRNGSVCIAAINSPAAVTLSGDAVVLKDIASSLEADGVFCRLLSTDIPYHSARMDPLMSELRSSLASLQPHPAKTPVFSTVTGQAVAGTELSGEYWAENIRRPVLFSAALQSVIEAGSSVFLEISPHPVLTKSVMECHKAAETVTILPSLRNGEGDRRAMLSSLGRLYTLGCPVDWKSLYRNGEFVRLPTYPWQRERFWFESEEERQRRLKHSVHPLLGGRSESALPAWNSEIDTRREHAYLSGHCIRGAAVYPGAAYAEMALAAAREIFGGGAYAIEDVEFLRLCLLPETPQKLQLVLDSARATFDIFSLSDRAKSVWTRNATGKLRRAAQTDEGRHELPDSLKAHCEEEIPREDYYNRCRGVGLEYGAAFQRIDRIWRGKNEALALLRSDLPDEGAYLIHPAILDAAFQTVLGAMCVQERQDFGFLGLPVAIKQLKFYSSPNGSCWVHARLHAFSEASLNADLTVVDDQGRVCVEVRGLVCQALSGNMALPRSEIEKHLYASEWELKPRSAGVGLRRSGDYLLRTTRILEQIQPEVTRMREDVAQRRYEVTLEPQLRRWAISYSLKALEDLGWDFQSNPRFSAETLFSRLPILPEYHRLVRRMLQMLGEEGSLRKTGDQWEVVDLPDFRNIHEIEQSSWLHISAYLVECILLRRCGERMGDVLRGSLDPLEIIFPQGSFAYVQHLYQDSPTYQPYNFLISRAVDAALQELPPGRSARIIEVGGGTGGLTSYVLPLLRSKNVEYVFTDVSGVFISQARQSFEDYPFVQYRSLDVEADPVAQGFEPHYFDIILASDVLHATRDLRQSVDRLKTLLASNGLLMLLEGTNTSFLPIMVFGLLKSWWTFTDERVAQVDPRISTDGWRKLLLDGGFAAADVVSGLATGSEAAHSIILAEGPPCIDSGSLIAPTPSYDAPGRWLIAADSGGIGENIASWLRQHGEEVIVAHRAAEFGRPGPVKFSVREDRVEDWERTIQSGSLPWRGVVHLWSLDIPDADENPHAFFDAARRWGCLSASTLIQAVAKLPSGCPPRVWLITRGAQPASTDQVSISISQAPLWGLGRVVMNEHPSLQCTLVDLDPRRQDEVHWLMHELCAEGQENEIALRGDARYVHRFNRASIATLAPDKGRPSGRNVPALQIEIASPGVLESVRTRVIPRPKPEPHEVEIEIHASGLNFKDLMIALGTLPRAAFEAGYTGPRLGIECSGLITAVGENVSELAVGQEVLACAPATLASHTRVDASFVVPKPPQLTFEEAAGIPVAFSTAHYALHHLSRLQKGERILIHAAAGGVGLAAVQLAKRLGAEVFATAGSPDKREFLRAVGVQYVSDSRSLEFADDIMQWTSGRGVDVVLNSLAGEAIAKGISALAPYGRFIEIGKYDIYANSKLALRPFSNNISFIAVDVDRLMKERPAVAAGIAREVAEYFAAGELYPLPHRVFPATRVSAALRYLAQARHLGKIIVSLRQIRDLPVAPVTETSPAFSFRDDASYLLTGGLRGFGLQAARWLAERGARHIVLMGRSGAASPEAIAGLEHLRASGVDARAVAADVSKEDDIRRVLDVIAQSMPPLRGVFHAAMVLDDTLLTELNDDRLANVMAPKVLGAWNLHTLTGGSGLDHFVLFSSMSSLFGTPSQGNYAAANSFLDALAWYRRARGLPACTVNWGVVADAGHVARHPEVARMLESQLGATGTSAAELLQTLGRLLGAGAIQPSIVNLNWQHVSAAMQTVRSSPRFANVLAEAQLGSDHEARRSILTTLNGTPPEERKQVLAMHVLKEIALIMGASPSSLDLDTAMINLGIDSLMAVELKNRVELDFGIQLNATQFLGGLTLGGMIDLLYEHAVNRLPCSATALPTQRETKRTIAENAENLVDNLDQLSEEQVDSLLRAAVKGQV